MNNVENSFFVARNPLHEVLSLIFFTIESFFVSFIVQAVNTTDFYPLVYSMYLNPYILPLKLLLKDSLVSSLPKSKTNVYEHNYGLLIHSFIDLTEVNTLPANIQRIYRREKKPTKSVLTLRFYKNCYISS